MITYGTNPAMGIRSVAVSPPRPTRRTRASAVEHALEYMDLKPGQAIIGHQIDVVFVGSCTNGRLSATCASPRASSRPPRRHGVRLIVVPGSYEVKREAEREGLAEIFKAAGAEWREAGCTMCIAMNGDQLQPGQYRCQYQQPELRRPAGEGRRTFLASPLTAAASAIDGVVADPRRLPGIESLAAVGGR